MSGEYVTRPMAGVLGLLGNVLRHHAIRFTTTNKNVWLLHSTPKTGTVVTSAATMTNVWTVDESFSCRGKTVGQVFDKANALITSGSSFDNYLLSGTCVAVAKRAMEFCKTGSIGSWRKSLRETIGR